MGDAEGESMAGPSRRKNLRKVGRGGKSTPYGNAPAMLEDGTTRRGRPQQGPRSAGGEGSTSRRPNTRTSSLNINNMALDSGASGRKGVLGRALAQASNSTSGAGGAIEGSAVENLRRFLLNRWNAEMKFLNLENLASDPILSSSGTGVPGQKGSSAKLAPALWKLAGEMFPNIVSLSLANNTHCPIALLAPSALVFHLPNVQNLSLESMGIKRLAEIQAFSPRQPNGQEKSTSSGRHGMTNLKELILRGNPVEPMEEDKLVIFRRQLKKRFPALQMLDQVSLANSGGFPAGILPGFRDSDDTDRLVNVFAAKFFQLFDTSRHDLLPAYHPNATFSFSANTNKNERMWTKDLRETMPNQNKLDWQPYIYGPTRNLTRVRGPRRYDSLFTGPERILEGFKSIAPTSHSPDASRWMIDAWTVPGQTLVEGSGMSLFVTVHGEFAETATGGIRSFDRAFILAPALDGSAAQTTGWPCMIVSDELLVRAFADPEAWSPTALPFSGPPPAAVNAPGQPVASASPVQPTPQVDQPQLEQLVIQFSAETRLTLPFAKQCLEENQWNPIQAKTVFDSVRASIPPEAFIQQ